MDTCTESGEAQEEQKGKAKGHERPKTTCSIRGRTAPIKSAGELRNPTTRMFKHGDVPLQDIDPL